MKSENLIIRITPMLKEQARALAAAEGKGLSEWLTDLIKAELRRKEETA
jgi:predicted HicB family RNase H-like nuclease